MKLIAALGALLLFLVATATPSNAQNSTRFSQASGMSKTQLTALMSSLNKAQSLMFSKMTTKTTISNLSATTTMNADSTYSCSKGGYIHSIFTLKMIASTSIIGSTSNVSTNGSGYQSIVNWRCVTGWTVNGDPNISLLLTQTEFAGTTHVWLYFGNGFKATGPNKLKQSCRLTSEMAWSSMYKLGGFNNVHVKCVPGGSTDLTLHF